MMLWAAFAAEELNDWAAQRISTYNKEFKSASSNHFNNETPCNFS